MERRLARAGPWTTGAFLLSVALLPIFGPSPFITESVVAINLLLMCVVSWDFHCGPTRQASFGHSLFIGGAAYLSSMLTTKSGWTIGQAAPLAVLACGVVGLGMGWVLQRCRGPKFALLTMAGQLALYQVIFLFPSVFGGEEGIVAVPLVAHSDLGRYYVTLGLTAVAITMRAVAHNSRFGLLLRAAGDDPELASSSGVSPGPVLSLSFAIAAMMAGAAGVLFAHNRGQVSAELAGSSMSVYVVLLALVGGRAAGQIVSVILFCSLQRAMPGVIPYDAAIYAVLLFLATALFPTGLSGSRR